MLTGPDGLEADKGNLHTGKSPNGVPGRISYVETASEASHKDKNQSVKRNHVCNECITTLKKILI